MKFPDDCLQQVISPEDWWVSDAGTVATRGSLIKAFIPHIDHTPYTLRPTGRRHPEQHNAAFYEVSVLNASSVARQTDLPVAAMPLFDGEIYALYRAKRRPCLVIGESGTLVPSDLTRGMASRSTAPTLLVAPFYGVDQKTGKRAGYRPEFVERVRHCQYPQFHWDKLPLDGSEESIMRLDQIQPIGAHTKSYALTGHRLSESAMGIIDELVLWLTRGGVPEDSLVALYRGLIEETFEPK